MKLKTTAQDFSVIEHIDMPSGGKYFLYKVKKCNVSSSVLARKFNIRFAGMKDSKSVSVQYGTSEQIIKNEDFVFVKKVPRHIRSTDIISNEFKVVLRDLNVSRYKRCPKTYSFTNYFGEQRFWSATPLEDVNSFFVHHILSGDFERAVKTACTHGGIGVAARRRRELKKKWGDVNIISKLPERDWVRKVISKLPDHKLALQQIPLIDRKFAVRAYQAYLWNKKVSGLSKGRLVEYSYGSFRSNTPRKTFPYADLILPSWYGVEAPTGDRETVVTADIVSCKVRRETVKLHFFLPRGVYATVFLQQLDAFI